MLVLSRFVDEWIDVGDPAEVSILVLEIRDEHGKRLKKAKVRLGIKAPSDITVNRREVLEDIQRNGKAK